MMMNTPFHLNQKTILVTGASSGIGRATAQHISRMGGTVILSGRDERRLNETLQSLEGKNHRIIAADLLESSGRDRIAAETLSLDGLVQCAGVVHPFPVRFLDEKKIDETFRINFDAPVLLVSALQKARKLNRDASLVFLSSISADHPHKGSAMYAASKSAIESFTRVLAIELAAQGIRANSLAPGMVKTPMYDHAEAQISKEEMDKHVARYPLGVGLPEDVANAAVFLLSPASRWITGITIRLDGGLLIS